MNMNKIQLLDRLDQRGFSRKIIKAFEKVKRENFVPENIKKYSYEDTALPIGNGQTISQPYTIAVMLSLLDLKKDHKFLELGSGCGYVLALISEIIGKKRQVFGVEIIKELAELSKKNLKDYKNIEVYNLDGSKGLEEKSPFDRILISAALSVVPKPILNQLKEEGILVAPIGDRQSQVIVAIQRKGDEFRIIKEMPGFIFVPFISGKNLE